MSARNQTPSGCNAPHHHKRNAPHHHPAQCICFPEGVPHPPHHPSTSHGDKWGDQSHKPPRQPPITAGQKQETGPSDPKRATTQHTTAQRDPPGSPKVFRTQRPTPARARGPKGGRHSEPSGTLTARAQRTRGENPRNTQTSHNTAHLCVARHTCLPEDVPHPSSHAGASTGIKGGLPFTPKSP